MSVIEGHELVPRRPPVHPDAPAAVGSNSSAGGSAHEAHDGTVESGAGVALLRRSPSPTAVAHQTSFRPPHSPNLSASSNCYTVDECYIEPCYLKMEKLVQEMQHPELGIPLRSQKLFLTSIPSAFVGYDVVEWIMDNLDIEDQSGPVAQEALHLANLLCQYGYFFPVGENAKTYTIKDDSTLYRFQSPMFWPSRNTPDNTDYAVYLLKRSLKNKPKTSLEDYEQEALQRLKKLLSTKWENLCQQAEDIVAQSKDKKKPDKMITSSQERAYWRLHRPPPGIASCLERCPVPSKRGPRRKTIEQLRRQSDILRRNLLKSRTKSLLWQRCEDYREFDAFLSTPLPSNPWITDDSTFWAIESPQCETPTERRLKRWTLSLEELLSDPRGFQEFEIYLRKEYSHENILFWKAVQNLKKGSPSNIAQKVQAIHNEYLAPGAACEVNLDSATMELTMEAVQRRPTRYTFEHAQQHAFTLMQTDTYPRFLRSEHFNSLLQKASLLQIQGQRKRFFHFGASTRKKSASQDQRVSTSQQSSISTSLQPNAGALVLYTKPPGGSSSDVRGEAFKKGGRRSRKGGGGNSSACSSKTPSNEVISDEDSALSGSLNAVGVGSATTGDVSSSAAAAAATGAVTSAGSPSGAGSINSPLGSGAGSGFGDAGKLAAFTRSKDASRTAAAGGASPSLPTSPFCGRLSHSTSDLHAIAAAAPAAHDSLTTAAATAAGGDHALFGYRQQQQQQRTQCPRCAAHGASGLSDLVSSAGAPEGEGFRRGQEGNGSRRHEKTASFSGRTTGPSSTAAACWCHGERGGCVSGAGVAERSPPAPPSTPSTPASPVAPSVSSRCGSADMQAVTDPADDLTGSSCCAGTTLRVPRWSHRASDPGSMALPSGLLAVPSQQQQQQQQHNTQHQLQKSPSSSRTTPTTPTTASDNTPNDPSDDNANGGEASDSGTDETQTKTEALIK